MEFLQFFQLLRRWWWLLVLAAVLGGGVGHVVSQSRSLVYEASTTLLVSSNTPTPNTQDALIPDQRSSLVKTYKELLLKRPVLEAVIADLGLAIDTETLAKQLSVTEVRDTQLLVLTAQDADPQTAATIANTTVKAFNQQTAALLSNPYATNRAGLSIVEPAAPPREPADSGRLRIIAIATMISLLLTMGIVFAFEYFDSSVRSAQDISMLTGLPITAQVKRLKGRRLYDKLVTIRSPFSSDAEVYRMIRLHLESGSNDQPLRSVVITSAGPREGKSITAANLAVALAQIGIRTVLIDANLRHPSVHELFRKPNVHGLTGAMQNEEGRQAYAYTIDSGVENLRLLLSGPLDDLALPSVARLLRPQYVLGLIEVLKEHADILIFDSPSVLDFIDTWLLARTCDAALLVVQARRTRAEALLQACDTLARSHACILGVVFNRVTRPTSNVPVGSYQVQDSLPMSVRQLPWPELPLDTHKGNLMVPLMNGNGRAKQVGGSESEFPERKRGM